GGAPRAAPGPGRLSPGRPDRDFPLSYDDRAPPSGLAPDGRARGKVAVMRSRRSGRWTGAVAAALAVVLLGPGATVPGAAAPVRVAGPPGAGLVAGCETFGFTAMPAVAGVAAPRDVEAVDTNQNGFDDLLVASASGDGDVHQLIAVGNGTFRTSVGPGA